MDLNFDIGLELLISAKMILACILGGILGFDRERHGKDAGIRTYAAVTVGATLFSSVAAHIPNDTSASSRILANIVTGVGFLGAGIIYRNSSGNSLGLTTAATIWCAAAIGVAVGLNMFVIAMAATGLLYAIISLHHLPWYNQWKSNQCTKPKPGKFETDL